MTMMNNTFRCLVNGQLINSIKSFEKLNPATGKLLTMVPDCDQHTADDAIDSAKQAFPKWASLTLDERRAYVKKIKETIIDNSDYLTLLLTQEQGKALPAARVEVDRTIAGCDGAMQMDFPVKVLLEDDSHKVEVHRKPIGVIAAIAPWNFPFMIGVNKVLKSIIAGNTVILKPSPFTPLTSLEFGRLIADILPAGVVNILSSNDSPNFNLGAYLVEHKDIKKVTFTGSVTTGKKILASSVQDLTRVTLELGGNDAAIVLDDADMDTTVNGIFNGFMANSGQVCVAIKRAYVHETIYDEFVRRLSILAQEKYKTVGNGTLDGVLYGPLNNINQLNIVKALVKDATEKGGKIECGGKAPPDSDKTPEQGYFYLPTIISNVKEGVRIVDEEQFGPVLPVIPFSTDDEAVNRANSSNFGLGGSVWSSNPTRANAIANRLEAGTVWVNQHMGKCGNSPFGGFKTSGIGREGDWSDHDLDAFTETQTLKFAK